MSAAVFFPLAFGPAPARAWLPSFDHVAGMCQVQEYKPPADVEFTSIFVPTEDTERYSALLNGLGKMSLPVLFVGDSGRYCSTWMVIVSRFQRLYTLCLPVAHERFVPGHPGLLSSLHTFLARPPRFWKGEKGLS